MTYLTKMDLKCANCRSSFYFSVSPEDKLKKVICPICQKEYGTFEMELDLNEMVMTEGVSDPMPAPTIIFRPLKPMPMKIIDMGYDKISQSSSSD